MATFRLGEVLCWSVWLGVGKVVNRTVSYRLSMASSGRVESSRVLSCRVSARLSSVAGGAGNVSFSAVRCRYCAVP